MGPPARAGVAQQYGGMGPGRRASAGARSPRDEQERSRAAPARPYLFGRVLYSEHTRRLRFKVGRVPAVPRSERGGIAFWPTFCAQAPRDRLRLLQDYNDRRSERPRPPTCPTQGPRVLRLIRG